MDWSSGVSGSLPGGVAAELMLWAGVCIRGQDSACMRGHAAGATPAAAAAAADCSKLRSRGSRCCAMPRAILSYPKGQAAARQNMWYVTPGEPQQAGGDKIYSRVCENIKCFW